MFYSFLLVHGFDLWVVSWIMPLGKLSYMFSLSVQFTSVKLD